jgi:hypothetical protein
LTDQVEPDELGLRVADGTEPSSYEQAPVTEELPAVADWTAAVAPVPATATAHEGAEMLAIAPWDQESDDVDLEWATQTVSKRVRLKMPTAILTGLLIAAVAFWGGAAVQRGQGTGTTGLASRLGAAGAGGTAAATGTGGTTGAAGAGAGATSGATGAGGASSAFGAAATSAATGSVTVVDGDILYVTNVAGNIIKVVIPQYATITRNAKATASVLLPGDTVVVQGSTAKDGTVTAASIRATAAGVSSGRTGGGGGGGGGAFSGGAG